ncbi:Uma2 family endonuclease [Streptomyces pyxinae]|uniref:Uma2 family endonuclease n=1 Tax=Streptomyces pyxinae TaxID=2970734 RepID=UPI00286839B7|nr:Uma2 family endonuclease [Streptomyces sp. LP05-1]
MEGDEDDQRMLDSLFEMVEAVPEFSRYRVDVVEGAVLMSPQAEGHREILLSVVEQLRGVHPRQRLLSNVRIGFPGRLNGSCPDAAQLRAEEKAEGPEEKKDTRGRGRYERVEFVVEVASEGTAARDYGLKKDVCARAGVPGYLIVDPGPGPLPSGHATE